MTNRPHNAAKAARALARPPVVDAKYELVFEDGLSSNSRRPAPFSALEKLRERGGAALGDLYARLARVVLDRLERLEDLNAERRQRRLAETRPRAKSVPRLVSRRASASPPKRTS